MTTSPTPQAAPLEATAFDELSRSFRREPLLATSSGYDIVNFLDGDDDTGRVREVYGDHIYRRRAEVKARYDPDNAFRHNKNIRPG
jgi:Berberine and berberine like